MKKRVLGIFVAFIFLSFFIMSISIAGSNLEIKSVLLKSSVNKGDSITRNIEVYSEEGGEVKIFVRGIEGGVSVDKDEIMLNKGERKNIGVVFDSKPIEKGVYVGHIEFQEEKESEIVPVIFEVESKGKFFDANLEIPQEYSEINPDEKMRVHLRIFDLNSGGGLKKGLGPTSIDVEYNIHDLDGNIISYENENLVIDGQSLITKTVAFPKDIKNALYIFSVAVKYKSSVGTSTDSFRITDNKSDRFSGNFLNAGNFGLIFILIFMAFIFLVLILFFVFMIYERNKLFLELRRYNSQEIRGQKRLIEQRIKLVKKKGGKKEIKKEINRKVKRLKKIHRERINEFKKLRKEGKVDEMRRKLQKWKREGYRMIAEEKKTQKISEREKNKELKDLKKKGYDTSFLGR